MTFGDKKDHNERGMSHIMVLGMTSVLLFFASPILAQVGSQADPDSWMGLVVQAGALGVLLLATWMFFGKFMPMLIEEQRNSRESYQQSLADTVEKHSQAVDMLTERHSESVDAVIDRLEGQISQVNHRIDDIAGVA